jgi:hypothetical protein
MALWLRMCSPLIQFCQDGECISLIICQDD